jgi:hypothetical protein
MANNNGNGGDSGMGFLMGVVLLIAFMFFLWYWGVPAARRSFEGTQINVPSKIDVNINQQK